MLLQLRHFAFALAFVSIALMASFAHAAGATMGSTPKVEAAASPPETADLQRLVDTLEDDARRKAFLGDLKALIAVQDQKDKSSDPPVGARLLKLLSEKIDNAGKQLGHAVEAMLDIPRIVGLIREGLASAEQRANWLWLIAKLAAIIAVGLIADLVVRRLLRGPHALIEAQSAGSTPMRLLLVVLRTVLDLIAVAGFVAAAYAVMTLVDPISHARVVALALINAIAGSRVILAMAKMIFAPRLSKMRLFAMGDETANYGFLWCRRLTYLTVYGYFGIEAITALGASGSAHGLMMKTLGLVICLLLIMLVLQNRHAVAHEIRRDAGPMVTSFLRRLADVWHLIVIVYLVTIYGVWSLEVPGGFEFILRATIVSFFIIVIVQGIVMVLGRLIRRGFSLSDDQRKKFPGLEARANRYLPVLLVISQTVLYGIGALAFLQAWGFSILDWFYTPLGTALIARLATIGVIIAVAMVVWELVSAMIERYLSATDHDGRIIHRGQRIQTLLPLLRNVVLIVIAIMVTLTILSELGVDTGPLIAGAGILGLAVGFGAQTFVKDVITGFFILVEDAVAVGDLVEVGGHRGKVEAMSIRSIQLRDVRGDVHRVPFSEVTSTVNRSKAFSFAFFDIGVAYREDVDHCMNVIREVGGEVLSDPVFAPDILEGIEIMGVESFDESAVTIRARIKVKAGKQRGVQRGFNRLLKKRFDAEGIEIPFPHRTIYFGVDSRGEAPPAHVQMLAGGPARKPVGPAAPVQLTKRPEGEQSDFEEIASDDDDAKPKE